MTDNNVAKAPLTKLLTLILQTQYNTNTTLLDHNNQEFALNDDMNEAQHLPWIKKEFKAPVHKVNPRGGNRATRIYTTHKIHTTVSLSTIKNHQLLRKKMRQYNAFMTLHQFALNKWDVAHLGFLTGYNITHVNKHQTKLRLMQETQAINDSTPPLELALTMVNSAPDKKNTMIYSTQACEVQCLREHAPKLTSILSKLIVKNKKAFFVPYGFKNHKPKAKDFCTAVQHQLRNSKTIWVIKVQGFTNQAMKYLLKELRTQPGFHMVTPTRLVHEIGEWKLLVHKDHLNTFYDWLTMNLSTITMMFPADTMIPDNYLEFEVTSGNPRVYYEDTDNQTDAASFGTMFTNSMEETEGEFNDNEFQPKELFKSTVTNAPSTDTGAFDLPPPNYYPTTAQGQQTYAEIAKHAVRGKHPAPNQAKKSYWWNPQQSYYNTNIQHDYNTSNIYHYDGYDHLGIAQMPWSPTPPANTQPSSTNPPQANPEAPHPLEQIVEELRVANRDQAAQIALLSEKIQAMTNSHLAIQESNQAIQDEMKVPCAGITALLHQQALATSLGSTTLSASQPPSTINITAATPHTTPSNKRQNTMPTPTKQRPDNPNHCPDVDFDSQPETSD